MYSHSRSVELGVMAMVGYSPFILFWGFIPFLASLFPFWPVYSTLLLISPFFFILIRIAWQFHLFIVLELLQVGVSCLLTTARIHLLSVNLATSPAQRNLYFFYTTIASFILHHSRITSPRMCSRNAIPNLNHSIALCVVTTHCSTCRK